MRLRWSESNLRGVREGGLYGSDQETIRRMDGDDHNSLLGVLRALAHLACPHCAISWGSPAAPILLRRAAGWGAVVGRCESSTDHLRSSAVPKSCGNFLMTSPNGAFASWKVSRTDWA